jgi:hypothetical protein
MSSTSGVNSGPKPDLDSDSDSDISCSDSVTSGLLYSDSESDDSDSDLATPVPGSVYIPDLAASHVAYTSDVVTRRRTVLTALQNAHSWETLPWYLPMLLKLDVMTDESIVDALLSLVNVCSDANVMRYMCSWTFVKTRRQVQMLLDSKEARREFDPEASFWKLAVRGGARFPDEFGARPWLTTDASLVESVLSWNVLVVCFVPGSYELVDKALDIACNKHCKVLEVAKRYFDETPRGKRLAVKCLAVFKESASCVLDAWHPSMFESRKYFLICASLAAQELTRFPREFLSDEPTVLEAILAAQSPWRHAHMVSNVWRLMGQNLASDKTFVVQAMALTTRCGTLKYVVPALRSDLDVLEVAFQANPTNLVWAPKDFRTKTRRLVCLSTQGCLIQHFADADATEASIAVRQNTKAYKHLSTTLRSNVDIVLDAWMSSKNCGETRSLLLCVPKRILKSLHFNLPEH